MLATAERGEDSRVARPSDFLPAHALQYGQLPAHSAGHAPNFTPYHPSHGHVNTSVESAPSTAYPSPRTMPSNQYLDNSSVSSSSRESSVYSETPTSSVTAKAGLAYNLRSTRTKRGSDSHGSSSGRGSKRPPTSKSGDEFFAWCDACKCLFRDCSTPKEHERKSKKIDKEKASRCRQALALQDAEDYLANLCDLSPLKPQMPGNQKKSGLAYDKQQIIEALLIVIDMQTRDHASLLGREASDELGRRMSQIIKQRVSTKGGEGAILQGSLLASKSGEERCMHELRLSNCDNPIKCRKARRATNWNNNRARIFASGDTAASTPTPTPATAAAAAATSLPMRSSHGRRNLGRL